MPTRSVPAARFAAVAALLVLSCDPNYVIDPAAPHNAQGLCGNGLIDTGEVCDGVLLDGRTCQSEGFWGGNLLCNSACVLDAATCTCEGMPVGESTAACPATCQDKDQDGHYDINCGGTDCDDAAAAIHPGAAEICADGIDNDCDDTTSDLFDGDDDGANCLDDCNDGDPTIYPGAPEACADGIDSNCDNDEDDIIDADSDGFDCLADCNDLDNTVYPGAPERCLDGIDNDCNPSTTDIDEKDRDGDGATCVYDCNDNDPALNNQDNDRDGWSTCDGDCDDRNAALNLRDEDGDGSTTCDGDCDDADHTLNLKDSDNDGSTTCDGDCDDAVATTYPGAPELCDDIDNDCNGIINDNVTVDADNDGMPDCDDNCPTDFNPGPDSVLEITFEWLATRVSTDATATYTFYLNDIELGSTTQNSNPLRYTGGQIDSITYTSTDSLSAWVGSGADTLRFTKTADADFFAWIRVKLRYPTDPNRTQDLCLYDHLGGNCDEMNMFVSRYCDDDAVPPAPCAFDIATRIMPQQLDTDRDGFGDVCDCAPRNPSVGEGC